MVKRPDCRIQDFDLRDHQLIMDLSDHAVDLTDHQLMDLSDNAVPVHYSSSSCLGRGKKLADVIIPGIPEKFRDDSLPLHTERNLYKKHHGENARGRGRGRKMKGIDWGKPLFPDRGTDQGTPDTDFVNGRSDVPVEEETPENLFADDGTMTLTELLCLQEPLDVCCSTPVTRLSDFSVESKKDFPSLHDSRRTETQSISRNSKKPKPTRQKPTLPPASFWEKPTLADISKTLERDSSKGPVMHSALSSASFLELSDINKISDSSIGQSFSSSAKNMKTKQAVNKSSLTSVSVKEDAQFSDAAVSLIENNVSKMSVNPDPQSSSSCPMEAALKKIQTEMRKHTQKSEAAADKESGASEVKAKKEKKAGKLWKLEGPQVVQVDNVPTGCGEELIQTLGALGGVVNQSEKNKCKTGEKNKRKTGGYSWRISFANATQDLCDHVVTCLNNQETLFKGQVEPLQCRCLGEDEDEEN